jgi:DNA-directed RNA polymerase specialized sigma24 family protein
METDIEFSERAERHRRELHVHCYRMLGSFDEAEDAVQEVMLQAWRRRADLERPEHLRAWLYKIATNRCLDHLRSNQRRVATLSSFKDVPWLEPYPDRLLAEAAPAEADPAAGGAGAAGRARLARGGGRRAPRAVGAGGEQRPAAGPSHPAVRPSGGRAGGLGARPPGRR